VRNGELDRPLVKRDASPSDTKTAKEEQALKSNDWYEKAALSISAARKRGAKPHSKRMWRVRKIRGVELRAQSRLPGTEFLDAETKR
jgi:hypothetical protein